MVTRPSAEGSRGLDQDHRESFSGHTVKNLHHFILGIMVASGIASASASGQPAAAPGQPPREPVTLALASGSLPSGTPFLIRRGPGLRDVVVLHSEATAGELSAAVRALLLVRQRSGDASTAPALLRMRTSQKRVSVPKEFPWAQRVLADLRNAQVQRIPGTGHVQTVTIWLPRQKRNSSTRPRGPS